ncbi:hypothetical protein Slin15195_G040090 [Septoria linicola]|uniref:Uncharacterized protein n=1 Tax=Septoria linicola TaxID=215465 RepID=A0A9Q9AKH0_9PEZI|nr:hypothetical protein Slin15195_G040090 [Septoria linicola]
MAQGKKRPSSASETPPAKRRAGSKSTAKPTSDITQEDLSESSQEAATLVIPGPAAANRLRWTPKLRKAIKDAGRETPRSLFSVLCHPSTQDLSSCSRVCGYEYKSKHLPDSIFDLSPGDLLTSTLSDRPGSAFNH